MNAQLANIRQRTGEAGRADAAARLQRDCAGPERAFNALIARKSISWTRIFFRPQRRLLPPNVRVLAVRPLVNTQNQLFLDMTVAADSPEPVIAFIVKLEGSDVFGSTAVSGITPPRRLTRYYRCRLSVNYAQKL